MKTILVNLLNVKSAGQLTYMVNLLSEVAPLHDYRFTFLINTIAENRLNDMAVDIPKNVSIYTVASRYSFGVTSYLWQIFNLPRIARELKPSYIYAPTHIAYKIPHIKTILAMRNMAIPNFLTIDVPFRMRLSLFFKYLPLRYALRKADKIVAVSNYVKDFLKNSIGKDEKDIFVAYHWVNNLHKDDLPQAGQCCDINEKDYVIFIPGSYYRYKKFHELLEYLDHTEMPSNARVVFAGDEADKRYLARLRHRKTDLYRPVFKTGLNMQEMKFLYKTAKLVILSSQVEACPNIAIEALANKSNILANNIPPYREILGNFARYFDICDKNDFIQQFNKAISSVPDMAIQMEQIDRINHGSISDLLSFCESQ
jgi:hypothetical protein